MSDTSARYRGRLWHWSVMALWAVTLVLFLPAGARAADTKPPKTLVKLIFIHHSCGENWLADGNGGLAKALQENNYFVSDTNYGWGPQSIGDRTDITNWPEWFTGSKSRRYLKALYAESEVNSPYGRSRSDPGGENRVVMFKSCFPNSELGGRPNDPPRRGDDLTVGNAKAIYNDLLKYFATRPDKLFVAVTAPPVQNPARAANARAFNRWLVNDWLTGYKGGNVAVFDFYNVLTDPGNHHRVSGGKIQYVTNRGKNTLCYPSARDDDHPTAAGNRKATKEFVPLLNLAVNRWLPTAGKAPASSPAPTKTAAVEKSPAPALKKGALIDDFETADREWEAFTDPEKKTKLTIKRDRSKAMGGKHGLKIDYDVAGESWATCSLINPSPQNWSTYKGVRVYVHAPKAGRPFFITAHGGKPGGLTHFEYAAETTTQAVKGWQKIDVKWNQFIQPEWEAAGGNRFNPKQAMGLAIILIDEDGKRNKGSLWVDDVQFLK